MRIISPTTFFLFTRSAMGGKLLPRKLVKFRLFQRSNRIKCAVGNYNLAGFWYHKWLPVGFKNECMRLKNNTHSEPWINSKLRSRFDPDSSHIKAVSKVTIAFNIRERAFDKDPVVGFLLSPPIYQHRVRVELHFGSFCVSLRPINIRDYSLLIHEASGDQRARISSIGRNADIH